MSNPSNVFSGKPKPLPPPRSQSLEGVQGTGAGEQEVLHRPASPAPDPPPPSSSTTSLAQPQQNPATEPTTIYANLGQLRSGLAPHKPQRTASMREAEQRGAGGEQEQEKEGKTSRTEEVLPPSPTSQHFHAKTASMTGSVDSEAPSDSTLSFPSTDSRRKLRGDGSEADSERDSVSPQRGHDEVIFFVAKTGKGWKMMMTMRRLHPGCPAWRCISGHSMHRMADGFCTSTQVYPGALFTVLCALCTLPVH